MELRQVVGKRDREIFGERLAATRANRASKFRDKAGAKLTEIHLQYGDLYALVGDGCPVEDMKAGFIVHSLAVFPQSAPKPDLSHMSPNEVLEGSEFFSLEPGYGRMSLILSGAIIGLMQARALLIYAITEPADIVSFVAPSGFKAAGEAFRWPYAETLDGKDVWVRPMLLEGAALTQYVRAGFEMAFSVSGAGRLVRLADGAQHLHS